MLLKLHNVYAGYDGSDVLKGIDLQMEQGTTTCIVGPNGAGKTTTVEKNGRTEMPPGRVRAIGLLVNRPPPRGGCRSFRLPILLAN